MTTWTESTVKPSDLKKHPKNPRKIGKDAFAKLCASIEALGYYAPIIVDETNTILAGHQRFEALKKLGHKTISVRKPEKPLTEEQKLRLLASDNLQRGEWDLDILANEFDYEKLIDWGFDESILKDILATPMEGLTDENEIPEPPKEPKSKRGDIYQLGNHRVMCGDSTSADDVAKLLNGVKPNLMVTDPPYGVNYDPAWREGADLGVGKRSKGKVQNDHRADWKDAYSLFPGNIAYVWHGGLHTTTVAQNLMDCGFKCRAQIIWVKQHFVLSRGDYHWQHEPCWYAVKEKGDWKGDRKQTTIWHIENNNAFGKKEEKEDTFGHGTQKPVECMRRPIENNSSPGQTVYDPFLGSGTTVIAAEQTGRICYGLEIDPAYVDVIVSRWEKFTGNKAELIKP